LTPTTRGSSSRTHRTVEQFPVKEIPATGELIADPNYVAKYVNFPLQFTTVEVELSARERGQLRRLGFVDCRDDAEILRDAVMRWIFRNRTRRGKLRTTAASK